jgi:SAM-dependent methyltransferase
VIGDITPAHARGLATRFDRIERMPLGYLEQVIAPSDPSAPCGGKPMHGDGSVDCVLSDDLVAKWSDSSRSPFRDPRFARVLSEIQGLLRPGGCLFLSGRNARWFGALLRRGQPYFHLGAARAALAEAGFSETRAYFADQFSVVPACRRAVRAYERLPGAGSAVRTWWAAGGLYELLYRDAFVLAIK